jgi:(4-alkanoyl-5-oxo-2,5-dihydrofuran-3-yl)methyl phosphate reductase
MGVREVARRSSDVARMKATVQQDAAVLVTGATGVVGSGVVHDLLERGYRPRVFVRSGERARAYFGDRVDVATGDLRDPGSLRQALQGIDVLFLVTSGPDLAQIDEEAAGIARSAHVDRIVKLSSMDAAEGVGTGVWHARGEAAIRASGVAFTFVAPAGFMSNALFWADSIKAEGIVHSCTGFGRIAFVHPGDIAAVATEAIADPKFVGAWLPLTGPRALSYAEMARRIGTIIGRQIRFEPIDEEAVRNAMGDEEGAVIEAHLSIYRAIRDGRLATVTDTVQRVLGRPPFSFDQWIVENIAAFGRPGQVPGLHAPAHACQAR